MASRLFEKYKSEIKPVLETEFPKNKTLTAKLEKVVISVGAGEAMKDSKLIQNIEDTISLIAGQRAVKVIAKKSVAGFKVAGDSNSATSLPLVVVSTTGFSTSIATSSATIVDVSCSTFVNFSPPCTTI